MVLDTRIVLMPPSFSGAKSLKERTIVFDVGGVLVDYHRQPMLDAITSACAPGTSSEAVSTIMSSLNLSAGHNTTHDLLSKLQAQLGFAENHDTLLSFWNASLQKRDWVTAMLSDLNNEATLHILSDTNLGHWSHIADNLLELHHFDQIFLSHETMMMKTSEGIFHHVLSEINQPAHACLFIDDTLPNVEVARRCGFQAHHYQSKPEMVAAIDAHLNS